MIGRLVRVAIAAGCALLAAIMACLWIIALAWDEPWREWVPAGLGLLFVILALGIGRPALRRGPSDRAPFSRVRREWRRDRQLMEQAVATWRGEPTTHERAPT